MGRGRFRLLALPAQEFSDVKAPCEGRNLCEAFLTEEDFTPIIGYLCP